ncbi:MAG: hypothetical protein JNM17_13740 [Archangium sp.]|nr:hypothetical protein [Archangium sp.]
MPSSALLRSLPDPASMQRTLRSLTMLDAIVAPDFRAFEWHPRWGKRQQMGAFKDGSGNFFFAWFSVKGTVIRGFDHESKMSPFQHDPPREWPGLTKGLPAALSYAKKEPAFALEELTFCTWNTGDGWKCGPVKMAKRGDGSEELLACFRSDFSKFAPKHFDQKFDRSALDALRDFKPLSKPLLDSISRDRDQAMVKEEAKLCGFVLE